MLGEDIYVDDPSEQRCWRWVGSPWQSCCAAARPAACCICRWQAITYPSRTASSLAPKMWSALPSLAGSSRAYFVPFPTDSYANVYPSQVGKR